MKGLLLKELYLLKNHCRLQLICLLWFVLAGILGGEQLSYFGFFSCMYAAVFPITLLSYDEFHKWDVYSRIFPYTPKMIVSAKYLVGLALQLFVLVVMCVAQVIKSAVKGHFSAEETIAFLAVNLLICSVSLGLNLPINFRFGTAKGRIVYYVVLGVGVGCCVAVGNLFSTLFSPDLAHILSVGAPVLWLIPILVAVGIYVGSWFLSFAFYKKRYR